MVMSVVEFKASLSDAAPPPELSAARAALWWAAKSNWDAAHQIVQDANDANSAWVHAYLHRIEGDLGNAGYWYRRAGRSVATGALDAEWEAIVSALFSGAGGGRQVG
jgi:hypothetical protein